LILLQGSGDDVKAFASTGTGIRIFTINHNGDSSFYLDLKDSEGEHIEYLASEYGPYSGKTSIQLGSAIYYLDIDASGSWSIEITPSVTEHALPSGSSILLQGSGDDMKAFTSTGTGLRVFTMIYTGASFFDPNLKDSQGNIIDYLTSEYGPYSGKTSVQLSSANYYLDVDASGPWSIEITPAVASTGSCPYTPIAIQGLFLPPTDPDKDCLWEDTNGNGRVDFNDVVVYFKNMEWIAQNEPVSCFDYNGNGRIDFNDVVFLFKRV
jgi:PKD repeat protein